MMDFRQGRPMKSHYIGIDVGGTKIAYGLFDKNKKLISRHKTKTLRMITQEAFVDQLYNDIGELTSKNGLRPVNIIGIGIGMPSNVDFNKGYIVITSNMDYIRDFDARGSLGQRFPDVQIVVDNDTNLAAIAEHAHGIAKGEENVIYTALSTGIGSAFIINNKIFRGSHGGAGESGHMIITPNEGVLCGCDNQGCFMSYASGSMICRHITREIEAGKKTCMAEMAKGGAIDCVILHEAYLAKDSMAVQMLDQMGKYIGVYLYNLYVTLNITCNVFGGGLLKFGAPLLDRIEDTFSYYNKDKLHKVEFRIAELTDDSGIIGAAEVLD